MSADRGYGIRVVKQGAVGWMVFDNPTKLNAISADMIDDGLDAITDLESDSAIAVMVLRGAGEKAFVSGGDISKFDKSKPTPEQMRKPYEFRARIENCPKTVIAMIHGYCLGGGLGIALCADLRFAADTGQLGIPAAKRGIAYPPQGLMKLLELVGPSVAKDLLFSARRVTADEAMRIGLVNRVFKAEDLERETLEYARIVAENAPLAVKAGKYFINQLTLEKAERKHDRMDAMMREAAASEDFKEATRAYGEKRKPTFQGR